MDEAEGKKWKVLVADDNRDVNEVVKRTLSEYGFDVIQAFDGQEAIDIFNESRPDLIFLDYRMPHMDGIDALKEIKKKDEHAAVVFITGEGSEDIAVKAMKAGANDYISKPISLPDLVHIANKLVRDHEILMENIRLKARGDAYKDYMVTITETMGEAVVTIDSRGTIQFMNSMARKFWGKLDEMKNKPVDVLIPDPSVDIFADINQAFADGIDNFENEYAFRKADGSIFSGLLTASALKSEKYAGGIVLVVRDLTDIEMMRRQIINAEKLASLGKVVEGVAHEIRNSLTSLGGFSRRLGNSVGADSNERVYVEYIIEDVKRLESMIMDIEEYVNYTKIHRPNFSATNIEDVIDEALIKTFGSGRFGGVAYEVNVPDAIDMIEADHNYLVEVFWHLFVNACESMQGKGSIEVNVSLHPQYLIVDVIDTGKGIPDDEIKDIFNPFYTSKVRGAGLGLSKVYMIIEEHGGFITVQSSVGKGTRIRVLLPRKRVIKAVAPQGAQVRNNNRWQKD
ncbi:MAG TPA: response regulator [Deltaproteobacteria bacterium]|nr:response regulator [Deltaproteobacteria bacterium]HPJ94197.1 response regulator [Deltaproteobacteria bacterium]HPR51420.1 response regulator [Deltaproteobacteria bacterium]